MRPPPSCRHAASCLLPTCTERRTAPLLIWTLFPQHPPKRLRQLEYIGGRGLLLGCGSKGVAPAAHYVTLAARSTEQNSGGDGGAGPSSDASWRLVYRSEVVRLAGMAHTIRHRLRAASTSLLTCSRDRLKWLALFTLAAQTVPLV